MSTPKVGDTKEIRIAEETLVIEPMTYGNLKKIIKIVAEAGTKLDPKTFKDDYLTVVPVLVQGYVDNVIPLLFKKSKHPFLNQDWIDENMTVPLLKEILVDALYVNGLSDFFLKTAKAPAPEAVQRPSGTAQSPTGSSGSITSLDSRTAGSPETSTP
jgi:hypothetical protein